MYAVISPPYQIKVSRTIAPSAQNLPQPTRPAVNLPHKRIGIKSRKNNEVNVKRVKLMPVSAAATAAAAAASAAVAVPDTHPCLVQ